MPDAEFGTHAVMLFGGGEYLDGGCAERGEQGGEAGGFFVKLGLVGGHVLSVGKMVFRQPETAWAA